MTIKIPQNNIFSIQPKSDLFGNIWYTKNMNFTEQGYAKLSSRAVSIVSKKDLSNFNIPISFGRYGTDWDIVTADKPWLLSITGSAVTTQQDTVSGAPQLESQSTGTWWQNLWHVVKDNTSTVGLYAKSNLASTWADKSVSLTEGVAHPIEVFRSLNTLLLGNGNSIKQVDSSYSTSGLTQLTTLPSDYEIIGLSYSNYKVGIITKLSAAAINQNQEAYFFVWDAVSLHANQGFPVGSDSILGITPYKSSWIILTRKGQVLYWNGGGFETLFNLPYYYLSLILGNSLTRTSLGNVLQVEGDLIYLNVLNGFGAFGKRKETYIENFPSGLLCYDPNIGIYNRYSPSTSPLVMGTANQANVNITTGVITINSSVVPATGNQVMPLTNESNPIGGIIPGTAYWMIKVSPTSFKLATSKQNALDGVFVTLTSQGDTTSVFAFLTITDYGISLNKNFVGGIGLLDSNTQISQHMLFGGTYDDYASTNTYPAICLVVPEFRNHGYMVTSKMMADGMEDIEQVIYAKYRPLNSTDKIIIKCKYEEILDLPVTTPQIPDLYVCNWTSDTVFTTQADISAAYTYLQTSGNELECEIINGAGAGSMAQISSILLSGSTYTVTLAESISGAAIGYYCNVLINNWKKLGEITSSDSMGYKQFPIAKHGKAVKFKVELRGVKVTIEELQIIKMVHVPAK